MDATITPDLIAQYNATCDTVWECYEALKRHIDAIAASPEDRDRMIRQVVEMLEI